MEAGSGEVLMWPISGGGQTQREEDGEKSTKVQSKANLKLLTEILSDLGRCREMRILSTGKESTVALLGVDGGVKQGRASDGVAWLWLTLLW